MAASPKAVRLAGMEFDRSSHACAFFRSREEEYRVLLPFAQEGFERGEKGFHIVDPRHRHERLQRLAQLGFDAEEAERTGQIEVRTWENAHLRQGRFDQYAMLALVEEVLTSGKAGGFGLTRFWANMEWALSKAIEVAKEEFSGIRTGRANPALVNRLQVDYYGTPTDLRELAGISAPEARLLVVSPYDRNAAAAIEKAIRNSDLGINPASDGQVIRLAFPQLT